MHDNNRAVFLYNFRVAPTIPAIGVVFLGVIRFFFLIFLFCIGVVIHGVTFQVAPAWQALLFLHIPFDQVGHVACGPHGCYIPG